MKKNKLYTVNKWNRPAFLKEEDENLFLLGGGTGIDQQQLFQHQEYVNTADQYGGFQTPIHNWRTADDGITTGTVSTPISSVTPSNVSTGTASNSFSPFRRSNNISQVNTGGGKNNAGGLSTDFNTLLGTGSFGSNNYSTRLYNSLVDSLNRGDSKPTFSWDAGEKTVGDSVKSLFNDYNKVKIDWSDPMQAKLAGENTKAIVDTFGDVSRATVKENGFDIGSKDTDAAKEVKSGLKSAAWQAAGSAALNAAGAIDTGERNGLFDTLDPVYHLAGGRESKVGNGLSDAGVALTKSGNPWLMLAGAGLKIVGGLTNAAFGIKTDKKGLAQAEQGIAANNNFVSNAGNFDELKGPEATFSNSDLFEGGWFSGGDARDKRDELSRRMLAAKSWAERSVENNARNISMDQINDFLANYSAFGGPINTPYVQPYNNGGGAIDYGFMSDYLVNKKKQAEHKNTMNNMFIGAPKGMFAFGGDVQTNSADFPTGLLHIGAGGTHESSPYDGVQIGTDSEGTPNLVEENETIWNDYVFSNRISIDSETKRKFHIGKKRNMTYAELSKRLEKEIAERPNDVISQASFNAQMETLANEQERQKQDMEAQKAREAFEALSPEEQAALMQQKAAYEQQQALAMQEQVPVVQEPSPEETAIIQQQMMQADGSEAMVGQEPQMAYGGKINRYDIGGKLKESIWNLIGVHTQSEWEDWKKKNGLDEIKDAEDWENVLKNEAIVKAITKDNPALAHALSSGYNFGTYIPNESGVTFDDNRGNWDNQTVKGWWGSEDPAWKQVLEAYKAKTGKDLTEDTELSKEELADYLRNTEAFQKGTKWLEDSEDNRLSYLQRIINNTDAPEKARKYAERFVDRNGWKEGAARDYNTIFNNPSGRAANPGTYWKTPIEAIRGKESGNYVINDDGSVEKIETEVPSDWIKDNTYSWASPVNDYTYNYYRKPTIDVAASASEKAAVNPEENSALENTVEVTPVLRKEWPRYAGLFGPAVGLGMMTAGIGKPDYSDLNAAVASGNAAPTLAGVKYIGDYERYSPLDIWYAQNMANANARATDRAIMNNATPIGTKVAGLLASGYNNQIANGQLFRQAQEYNDALYDRTKQFNRGTNQFNAQAYNQNQQFNAEALNRGRQYAAQLGLQAAQTKMDSEAGWYNSLYGNVGNIFKGLSDLGRENADRNQIARLVAVGAIPGINPENMMNAGWVKKKSKSQGGKLKKKRGLTF